MPPLNDKPVPLKPAELTMEQNQQLADLLTERRKYRLNGEGGYIDPNIVKDYDKKIVALDPEGGQAAINRQEGNIKADAIRAAEAQKVADAKALADKAAADLKAVTDVQKAMEDSMKKLDARLAQEADANAKAAAAKAAADLKAVEEAKMHEKASLDALQGRREGAVADAVKGMNLGRNEGEDRAIHDGVQDGINKTEALAKGNSVLQSVADLDGRPGISEADAKQAAALFDTMKKDGVVTDGAKNVLTQKVAAAKNTGQAL